MLNRLKECALDSEASKQTPVVAIVIKDTNQKYGTALENYLKHFHIYIAFRKKENSVLSFYFTCE